ncbi:MAG: hypothetical protein FWG53_05385 [Clostridiales bacterium]|nr:hypothetical protein [Clostridiales bacterium]
MEPLGIEKAESLGAILRAFRLEPLNADELARFYCDKTMAIRTGDKWNSPMDDLLEDCATPFGRNANLLLGHRGCGKSTELYKLKQRLEDAGQMVWIINAEAEMDLFQASCWDIMLGIAEGLCKIADKYGLELPCGTLGSVLRYLHNGYGGIEESEPGTAGSAGASGQLARVLQAFDVVKGELKANTVARSAMKEKMERRASEWISYIMEMSDWVVRGTGGKPPVLIFENIDKLQPPEKALEIFHYHALAQMPFPIVYTFPLSLCYDSRFALIKDFYEPHILPMIKVSNIDKSQSEEGIGVIREIVKLRADMKLFDENALTMLIEQTGGALRDLFACIIASARRASRRGAAKIEVEDARRTLSELGSELTRSISKSDYPMLASIYNDPKYKEQIEDSQFLLRQMQALVVMEYNGMRWHEIHPLIAEFLIEQGFINDHK